MQCICEVDWRIYL